MVLGMKQWICQWVEWSDVAQSNLYFDSGGFIDQ